MDIIKNTIAKSKAVIKLKILVDFKNNFFKNRNITL